MIESTVAFIFYCALIIIFLMCSPKRIKRKSNNKRFIALRKAKGHFPPPYPLGWYFLCYSNELMKDDILSFDILDINIVVFRNSEYKASAVNAFCPHLGTHLGSGRMDNGCIVCPYHEWTFDGCGNNVNIPYCTRAIENYSSRIHTKAWTCKEERGMIFLWHGDKQLFDLPIQSELDLRYKKVCSSRFQDWNMHIMEPSQNTADWYHFNTVHSWLAQNHYAKNKLIRVKHSIQSEYGKAEYAHRIITRETLDAIHFSPTIMGYRICDIRFPKWICSSIKTQVELYGPSLVIFKVFIKGVGNVRSVMTFTPLDDFLQKSYITSFSDINNPVLRYVIGCGLMHLTKSTVNQDREVWENKIHVSPRNLVGGDGTFAGYNKWLKQFYE